MDLCLPVYKEHEEVTICACAAADQNLAALLLWHIRDLNLMQIMCDHDN